MKQLPPSDRKSNQNNANYRKSIDISGNIPSIRWVLFIFSVIHVIESIQGCWHLQKTFKIELKQIFLQFLWKLEWKRDIKHHF